RRRTVDQADDGPPKSIVHDAVRLVSEEPAGAVAPLLAEDERVRVGGFGRVPDAPDERIAEVVHHVQAPAAAAQLEPVAHHALIAVVLPVDRRHPLQLWARVETEPADAV